MSKTAVIPFLTAQEAAESLGCRLEAGRRADAGEARITRAAADSRLVEKGALFVAMAGERTDGHLFIQKALEGGARIILAEEKALGDGRLDPALLKGEAAAEACFLLVEEPLAALQALARLYRQRYPDLIAVGVTGSNGKTTTKEMLGAILAEAGPVFISPGNLNSVIGLPLAVFGLRPEHRFAVFEMGMNHRGEMDILADILRPHVGIVTNIGTAHIGLLGSQGAIAEEKKKIFSRFGPGDKGFVPEKSPYRAFLTEGVAGEVKPFGERSLPGYKGWEDLGLDGILIRLTDQEIQLPLYGSYNLHNALAAISAARVLGLADAQIARGLRGVRPLFGRGQVFRGRVTIVEDCYNANPDSLSAALEFLDEVSWEGRKIAVMGAMKELGDETEKAHRALGCRLAASQAAAVFLAGSECRFTREALESSGYTGTLVHRETSEELEPLLEDCVLPGDLLYVKGSRGVALEKALSRLK